MISATYATTATSNGYENYTYSTSATATDDYGDYLDYPVFDFEKWERIQATLDGIALSCFDPVFTPQPYSKSEPVIGMPTGLSPPG